MRNRYTSRHFWDVPQGTPAVFGSFYDDGPDDNYTRRMHKQDKGAEVTSKLSKSMVDVWWIVRLEVTF